VIDFKTNLLIFFTLLFMCFPSCET
jgi:hypothetical protein